MALKSTNAARRVDNVKVIVKICNAIALDKRKKRSRAMRRLVEAAVLRDVRTTSNPIHAILPDLGGLAVPSPQASRQNSLPQPDVRQEENRTYRANGYQRR